MRYVKFAAVALAFPGLVTLIAILLWFVRGAHL
jgi:hypothetical protein